MATPESDAGVWKMWLHMQEVSAGLIPADSPVDFVRADWKPDAKGFPGWYGPDYNPRGREGKEFQKPVGDGKPPVLPSESADTSEK
jgi:hypothetical protein